MLPVELGRLEDMKVTMSIEHNKALAVSITSRYWDFSNWKNTPFGLTVVVCEDIRVDPFQQAVLFRRQILIVAGFDHCSGHDSRKGLWQEGSNYFRSTVGYGKSTRQWVWDLLVGREESVRTRCPWMRHPRLSGFRLAAPVAMFPKWLMRR